MRCDINSCFKMIGIWLIFHDRKCHHEICVCACDQTFPRCLGGFNIVISDLEVSAYFLLKCVFTFKIDVEKCSLWQIQVYFKTVSRFTF